MDSQGLFTDTSAPIRFLLFSFFLFSTFQLLVPCDLGPISAFERTKK